MEWAKRIVAVVAAAWAIWTVMPGRYPAILICCLLSLWLWRITKKRSS